MEVHGISHVKKAFAKSRKATISVDMSVRPHGRICLIFDILVLLKNLSRDFQVSLKSDKSIGYFT